MRNKVELKNGTILEVGKKYRVYYWDDEHFISILYIGNQVLLGKDEFGDEGTFDVKIGWLPYEEEKTENYCKILIERTDGALTSFEECFIKEKELIHLEDRVFNYVSYDVLKEYSSKEEMIKDLKK